MRRTLSKCEHPSRWCANSVWQCVPPALFNKREGNSTSRTRLHKRGLRIEQGVPPPLPKARGKLTAKTVSQCGATRKLAI
jgi:hypothetical protein